MNYMCSRDIYFSTTYHLSVYDMTYKALGRTCTGIFILSDKDEYNPPNKDMELERNYLLTLSSIHPEKSLETHEIFHPEK